MTSGRILIVEDSAPLAMSYAAQLTQAGYGVEVCSTGSEAIELLSGGQKFDVVLMDLHLPDITGLEVLTNHPDIAANTRIIVITADGSLARAVDAMRLGAYDFMVKPVNLQRLLAAVQNAAEHQKPAPKSGSTATIAQKSFFHGFIGDSPVMKTIYRSIENIADSTATVFITGESGTGKELAAQAVHNCGRRAAEPFIALNCGAIPENLLESEIFGHVKGAFTGAIENRTGAAKQADGGTLFLDEICEMELKLQVKLLRFLQTGMIQRVGASKPEPVDVRIICATNRKPALEVAEGRFREDLYYRLNVIPLDLPPLRDRGEDILQIARNFAGRFAREEGKEIGGLTDHSTRAITAHHWPGNVRELQNAIRRAIIMGSGPEVDIALDDRGTTEFYTPPAAAQGDGGRERSTAKPAPPTLPEALGTMTMEAIEEMVLAGRIEAMAGNVTKAARSLEISPSTIYRKLERWKQAS